MLATSSQEEIISRYIHRYLENEIQADDQLSPIARDSLLDIIRLEMRKLATERKPEGETGLSLLEQSVYNSLKRLNTSSSDQKTHALSAYFTEIKGSLQKTASEIFILQSKLEKQRINVETNSQVKFDSIGKYTVNCVGEVEDIKGLLASLESTWKSIEIDLDYLHQNFQVRGDWFPVEIIIEDLCFVLDDDGSVYVSIENLPSNLINSTYQKLGRIIGGMQRKTVD